MIGKRLWKSLYFCGLFGVIILIVCVSIVGLAKIPMGTPLFYILWGIPFPAFCFLCFRQFRRYQWDCENKSAGWYVFRILSIACIVFMVASAILTVVCFFHPL